MKEWLCVGTNVQTIETLVLRAMNRDHSTLLTILRLENQRTGLLKHIDQERAVKDKKTRKPH